LLSGIVTQVELGAMGNEQQLAQGLELRRTVAGKPPQLGLICELAGSIKRNRQLSPVSIKAVPVLDHCACSTRMSKPCLANEASVRKLPDASQSYSL